MLSNKTIVLGRNLLAKNKNGNTALKYSTAAAASPSDSKTQIKGYYDIPGPNRAPFFFGSMLNIKSFGGEFDILKYRDFQYELQSKYGDLVRWETFSQKNVFLFHPDYIKQVFKVDGLIPHRPAAEPFVKLQNLVGVNATLLNSQGERWRKLRSASNPIMARPQSIVNYISNQNQVANEMISYVERKFIENKADKKLSYNGFDQVLRLLALEYVSEIIFDERLLCVDEKKRDPTTDEFVKRIEEFFILFGILSFQPPIWKYYPTKDWKAFEAHGRFIYARVFEYIKQAQDKMEKEGAVNKAKTTVLSQYLSRREKYGLDMKDILAIMTDFLIAGVDTTAISIYHLMYELGLNQEVQQTLYDEIVSVVKKDEDITEDHIEKLKYLKMVVKESGRKHSIVPSNARFLSEDLVLENFLVEKGTLVNLCNSYITKSDRFFKNPAKFDPTRWEREDTEINPYSTLAFGFGARMCVGRRVAEQEIYLTIVKILQNYKLEYHETIPEIKIGLLATPNKPLNIVFNKRH